MGLQDSFKQIASRKYQTRAIYMQYAWAFKFYWCMKIYVMEQYQVAVCQVRLVFSTITAQVVFLKYKRRKIKKNKLGI